MHGNNCAWRHLLSNWWHKTFISRLWGIWFKLHHPWVLHALRCPQSKVDTIKSLIIRTSPFPGKMINYCILSIQTPTFEIIIPISEHLHLVELNQGSPNIYDSLCRTPTEFAWCLLAFNSLCGATARVIAHLLAYYSRLQTSTRLLLSLWSSSPGSLLKNVGRREPGNIREKSCRLPAHHHSCDQRRMLPL